MQTLPPFSLYPFCLYPTAPLWTNSAASTIQHPLEPSHRTQPPLHNQGWEQWGKELLTGEDGGHQCSKHEEEHGEEEEASIVEDFAGVVADVQVEQPDQHPDADVGHEAQVGQHLWVGRGDHEAGPRPLSIPEKGEPHSALLAPSKWLPSL